MMKPVVEQIVLALEQRNRIRHLRTASILVIVLGLLASIYIGFDMYDNYAAMQMRVSTVTKSIEDIKLGTPQSSIEVSAMGAQLKIVNEATWQGIFKLCFVWFFILVSIVAYRWANRRLQL